MTTTTNIDSNAIGNEQPEQSGPATTRQCTCHKFIRLHDGDCDVHGRVRKQLVDEDNGNEMTLSNFRVEYVKPDYSRGHSFEPRCAILADDAALGGVEVRVFDVPDPDESQREVAQFACDAMNEHGRLVSALKDCVESLKRLPDVDDAYRITCIRQAERALAGDDDEPVRVPCCMCGKPTTIDTTYGDLCYRCCRADNE